MFLIYYAPHISPLIYHAPYFSPPQARLGLGRMQYLHLLNQISFCLRSAPESCEIIPHFSPPQARLGPGRMQYLHLIDQVVYYEGLNGRLPML